MPDLVYAKRVRMMHAIHGMAKQKRYALTKEYPSKVDIIEKYGHDPKQMHHIYRLALMACNYFQYEYGFEESIWFDGVLKDELLELKTKPNHKDDLDDTIDLADYFLNETKKILNEVKESVDESTIDYSPVYKIKNITDDIIRESIKESVLNEI